jgi:7-cyano-7-deazaguanine reductase
MTKPAHGPLGKSVVYASRYDADLLFAIARAPSRLELGIGAAWPFHGVDVWNAYELSWLDARGKPCVALAEFRIPATSPNIVESKSFKLYLNSYNNERIASADELRARLQRDLAIAVGAEITVAVRLPGAFAQIDCDELEGESIDGCVIDIDDYGPPNRTHLRLAADPCEVEESLTSNLLKSNCPVTGQPDWASVQVRYAGAMIDRAGLLRYLVSFREHAEFHEHCVERIFIDVMRCCAPARLSVYARYTRRGGLDINPWRGTAGGIPANPRGARQ